MCGLLYPTKLTDTLNESPLLSREWNDLVFENRNKQYGAYVLRKETGKRYRRVGMIFLGVFLVLAVIAGVLGYFIYKKVQEISTEINEEVKHLEPVKTRNGFERKNISVGRRAVKVATTPGGRNTAPTIVDRRTVTAPIGIDGPDDSKQIDRSELVDQDIHHNADQPDLPVEGPQLTATEVVEEMPQFPGGYKAMVKFLDDNIVYSGAAQRLQLDGTCEVAFVVQPDGSITDIELTKKTQPMLDRAVITGIKRMPKWKPGKHKGKVSPVRVTIPITFVLFKDKG